MLRRPSHLSSLLAVSLLTSACGQAPPPAEGPVCASPPAPLRFSRHRQCGPRLDFTPVNSYQGEFRIVQEREDAVVLINGDCTGTLIAAVGGPVVLTAGHCVDLGDEATLAWNVEDAPDGPQLVSTGRTFEKSTEPDYALLRLDAVPAIVPTPLGTRPGDRLAIIQHPRGQPKVVAEGSFLDSCNGLAYYADLDTLVGSSGAGVLNRDGYLIGVHTDGDCRIDGGGTNHGWTAASVVEASPYLTPADLADR